MNLRIFGFLISLTLHGMLFLMVLWLNWRGGSAKLVPLPNTALCTIPLEVSAISDVSQAPISKPKGEIPEEKKAQSTPVPTEIIENVLPDPSEKSIAEEIPPKQKSAPLALEEKTLDAPPLKNEPSALDKNAPEILPKQIPLPSKKKQTEIKKPKAKKQKDSIDSAFDKAVNSVVHSKTSASSKKKSSKPQDFINVLKDIDENKRRGPEAETPITDPNSSSPYGAASIGPQLSMSIIDRVRRLLENQWRVPLRAQAAGTLRIAMRIYMRPNGTIEKAVVLPQESTTEHPSYPVGLESALRAIERFYTEPLPLPKDMYDQWKEFHFNFSTRS